jgi:hypothetical protein
VQVKITQKGGFVGDEVTLAELDTERLDAKARREVENMVAATRSRGASRGAAVGADLLEYNLTVDGQAMSWKDDGGESAAPIRDLLARVQQLQ